jgi:hypothetical protein
MKTNKLFLTTAAFLVIGSLAFTSCKKKQAFKEEDGQSSVDNRNVQQETDAAITEINAEVGSVANLHGRGASANGINAIHGALGITATGYTVNLADTANGSITIVYNGTVKDNRKREGSIKLTILDFANGKRWKQAGCLLQVEYINYKITRASDGKFVKLNGKQNLTNITGGTWWELLVIKTQTSLASSITSVGGLNVTFEDGKTAVYNINRKFTYTLPGGILTCTGEGLGTAESLSNLENYGTTRDGDVFTSQVSSPMVWNLTCGWHAPTQGAVEIKVDSKEFSLNATFAVDQSGNPVSVAVNNCAYGWKVEWKHKNKTKKKVFRYL